MKTQIFRYLVMFFMDKQGRCSGLKMKECAKQNQLMSKVAKADQASNKRKQIYWIENWAKDEPKASQNPF